MPFRPLEMRCTQQIWIFINNRPLRMQGRLIFEIGQAGQQNRAGGQKRKGTGSAKAQPLANVIPGT